MSIAMSRWTNAAPTGAAPRERFPKLARVIDYLDTLSERVDLATISKLLSELDITRADIESTCVFGERGYRRNTISSSPWYELLALCWRSGDCTPIHDHMGHSCAFRVVQGTGAEIRYALTPSGVICPATVSSMSPGYVCSADDPDIHQVCNMQEKGKDLVTLHIYSPPIKRMNVYAHAKPREFVPLEQDPVGHEGCL